MITDEQQAAFRQDMDLALAYSARHEEQMKKWVIDWKHLPIANDQFLVEHRGLAVTLEKTPPNLDHAVFFSEEEDQLFFSLHDKAGEVLGIIKIPNQKNENVSTSVTALSDSTEFFEDTLICFARDLEPEKLTQFLKEFPEYFSQNGAFIKSINNPTPPQLFPTEVVFQFWQLDKQADEPHRELLYYLLNANFFNVLMMYGFDSWEEFDQFDAIGRNNPEYGHRLVAKFTNILEQADHIELRINSPQKRKIHHHFIKLTLSVFKAAIHNHQNPEFNPDLALIALDSLFVLLNKTFDRQAPGLEQEKINFVDQFLQAKADDPNASALFQGLIESSLLEQTLSTAEFTAQSEFFYTTLGETLAQIASETTGDTEKETAFLLEIFDQVISSFPDEWTWLEAGCGSGRILKILYEKLKEKNTAPQTCLAIDRVKQNLPPDIPIQFFQKDLAKDKQLIPPECKKPNITTCEWSVINDNPPEEQQRILNNLSNNMEIGGILVLEFPTHEHYQAEVDRSGFLRKAFLGTDSTTGEFKEAEVPVHITRTGILLAGYAKESGFKPISPEKVLIPGMTHGVIKYRTNKGQERAFMVLEKFDEPATSYALAVIDDQKSS